MALPKDLGLISQLLSEKAVANADLNNLTKAGFYFVTGASHTPTSEIQWCHVIVTRYEQSDNTRTLQICVNDNDVDGLLCLWYRVQSNEHWSEWRKAARDDGQKYATMDQVTAEVTRILTSAEF